MAFPKIIHQTWKDTNIPQKWMKSYNSWRTLHPEWKYILWTDIMIREYILTHHPHLLYIHDSYPYNIQRADMIRYIVLYDFGGVYSDLDLYPVENINRFVDGICSDTAFVYSANTDCFTNALMMSKPGAKLWMEVFDLLKKPLPWYVFGKHMVVMKSTGPLMLTQALKDTQTTYSVLPKSMFNPYSVCDDLDVEKSGAVIRTLEGSSWHSFDSKIYNYVFRNRYLFIALAVVIVVLMVVSIVYLVYNLRRCRSSKNKCSIR